MSVYVGVGHTRAYIHLHVPRTPLHIGQTPTYRADTYISVCVILDQICRDTWVYVGQVVSCGIMWYRVGYVGIQGICRDTGEG